MVGAQTIEARSPTLFQIFTHNTKWPLTERGHMDTNYDMLPFVRTFVHTVSRCFRQNSAYKQGVTPRI